MKKTSLLTDYDICNQHLKANLSIIHHLKKTTIKFPVLPKWKCHSYNLCFETASVHLPKYNIVSLKKATQSKKVKSFFRFLKIFHYGHLLHCDGILLPRPTKASTLSVQPPVYRFLLGSSRPVGTSLSCTHPHCVVSCTPQEQQQPEVQRPLGLRLRPLPPKLSAYGADVIMQFVPTVVDS